MIMDKNHLDGYSSHLSHAPSEYISGPGGYFAIVGDVPEILEDDTSDCPERLMVNKEQVEICSRKS